MVTLLGTEITGPTLLTAIGLTSKFFLPTRTINPAISNPLSKTNIVHRYNRRCGKKGQMGEETKMDHKNTIAEKWGSENKSGECALSKAAHLRSDVFATGYFQASLDTACTGRDPIPDLKRGSAR